METGQVTEGSYRTLCLLSRTSRTVGSHWTGVPSGSVCWGGGVSTTGTHIASTARSSRFHQAYKMKKKSLLLVCKCHSLIKTFIRTFLYRNKLQMLFKHFFFWFDFESFQSFSRCKVHVYKYRYFQLTPGNTWQVSWERFYLERHSRSLRYRGDRSWQPGVWCRCWRYPLDRGRWCCWGCWRDNSDPGDSLWGSQHQFHWFLERLLLPLGRNN